MRARSWKEQRTEGVAAPEAQSQHQRLDGKAQRSERENVSPLTPLLEIQLAGHILKPVGKEVIHWGIHLPKHRGNIENEFMV